MPPPPRPQLPRRGPVVVPTAPPAAPPAAAEPEPAPKGLSLFSVLLNAGLFYLLFTQLTQRGSSIAEKQKAAAAAAALAASGGVGDLSALSAAAASSSTPLPAVPVLPPAPRSDPGGFMAMFEAMQQQAMGRRKVVTELQRYEDERLSRLESVPPSAKPLRCLWPLGTPFELLVFLSERADPITDFSEADLEETGADADLESGQRAKATTPSLLPNITFSALARRAASAAAASAAAEPPADGVALSEAAASVALTNGALRHGGSAAAPLLPHRPPLLWRVSGLRLGQDAASSSRTQHVNIEAPPHLQHNGTLYAHIYFVANGASLDPASTRFIRASVTRVVYPMVKFLKQRPRKETFSLLGAADAGGAGDKGVAPKRAGDGPVGFGFGLPSAAEQAAVAAAAAVADEADRAEAATAIAAGRDPAAPVFLSYWRPSLHVQLMEDNSPYAAAKLPPHMRGVADVLPQLGGYLPFVYINDFWQLNHHLVGPLNETASHVPLELSYSVGGPIRWALQSQMQASWDAQSAMGTAGEGDSDAIKGIITDANPLLLAVTVLVSLLHMVFEFLAFKNDISFWRAAKSMEGLSVRSITVNFVQMLIITLYLFENETSWMILFSQVVGLCIEAWKLSKAFAVNVRWGGPGAGLRGWLPSVDLADRDANYATSRTKEYDDIATHHMLIVLAPLVLGYASYSLAYERHRSWYSWLLTSAVNYVYLFGFVQLVPQLYINYRLKSVAHLPQRAYMYKFLTTIIDDLFAFVIKMPTLHRIAVFRDDVVFVLLIVQRYQYPIDKLRKNEYGTSALDEESRLKRERGEKRECARGKYEVRKLPAA